MFPPWHGVEIHFRRSLTKTRDGIRVGTNSHCRRNKRIASGVRYVRLIGRALERSLFLSLSLRLVIASLAPSPPLSRCLRPVSAIFLSGSASVTSRRDGMRRRVRTNGALRLSRLNAQAYLRTRDFRASDGDATKYWLHGGVLLCSVCRVREIYGPRL